MLADLVRVNYLPEVWLPSESTRRLRVLVRYRQQLKRERTEIKQQIGGLLRNERVEDQPKYLWTKAGRRWLRECPSLAEEARWVLSEQLDRLEQVDARTKAAEARLAQQTADDPVMAKLQRQAGVGPITAVTLRAEIGSFERFKSGKQLARYCGVTPCNASSGKRQADAGLVRSCNRELRSVVIEAAHRLVQRDPRWSALKSKLRAGGKGGSVATAAVANRWVRWLYHQMLKPAAVPLQQSIDELPQANALLARFNADISSGSPAAGPPALASCPVRPQGPAASQARDERRRRSRRQGSTTSIGSDVPK